MPAPSSHPSRRTVLGAVTALTAGLAGCAGFTGPAVTERSTQSYSVGSYDRVDVRNRNGDVLVESGDGEEVEVELVKRGRSQEALDRVSVTDEVADGTLTVRAEYQNDLSSVAVDLTVALPEGVALASARTGNGDATAREVPGDATVSTGNGDATAEDVDGHVTVESANGDAVARGTTGLLGAETANGDVEVEVFALREDVTCSTGNGDCEVGVGSDLDAAVLLRVGNGDVEVEEGVELEESERSRRRVEGRLGDGGPRLEASSGNGDVRLYALS